MKKEVTTTGYSLCEVVFVVFLILKLCNVINWSWWWVTAPLWVPLGVAIVVCLILLIIFGIDNLISRHKNKKAKTKSED